MKAMIFAAGLGTRLRPLTDNMPKALVPVCGRPLISIVIGRLISAGYDDIVINVHHFADMIEDYVHSMDDFGIRIRFSDERAGLLDTGGGILHARPLLEGDGRFLVHNVDILSDADLRRFYMNADPDAVATLLVSSRKTSRYLLFNDSMEMKGWTNVDSGLVRSPFLTGGAGEAAGSDAESFVSGNGLTGYAFSGIHLLSDRIFPYLEDYAAGLLSARQDTERKRADTSVRPVKFSITDFYIDSCAFCRISGAAPGHLDILDTGKPAALAEAERFIDRHRILRECSLRSALKE